MKNIFLILILSMISINLASANKIYIKLKQEHNSPSTLTKIYKNLGLEQSSRLLMPLKKYEYSLAKKLKSKPSLASEINQNLILTESHLLRTYTLFIDKDRRKVEKIIKDLRLNPKVEHAEIASISRLNVESENINSIAFNDPMIAQQRMLETIKAFAAWDIFAGSADVVIGISDGGTMQNHEDIKDNLATFDGEIPGNGVDDDGNGYIDDYNGYNMIGGTEAQGFGNSSNQGGAAAAHGTQTAGIAGATVGNGVGIAGVGGYCKIFPIKISPFGNAGLITHNYESIIMAADRGIDVLNCSWGGNSLYSPIEQSVIDYAVARDVVIIASSGNIDKSTPNDLIGPNYFPAGYDGVLSVMSSNPDDFIYQNGFKGDHHRIIAPGQKSVSTSAGSLSSYQSNLNGTSFASPIVAAAAALARGLHPNLTANQIIEFVRQCSDDISGLNAGYKDLISGRLNLEKVVSTDPMSMPGLRLLSKEIYSMDGEPNPKSKKGDTIRIRIKLKNYLADSGKLKISMRTAFEFQQNTISLISPAQNDVEISSGEEIVLADFIVKIEKNEVNFLVLRLDIEGENGYRDFIKTTIVPTSEVTDFENDYYIVSMADDGKIGFNENYFTNGKGIYSKEYGNFLFEGGIFVASPPQNKIVSANYGGQADNGSDFFSVSGFYEDEIGVSVFDDSKAQSRFDIKVTEQIFLKQGKDFVKIIAKLESDGGLISEPSLAWYFDFDVANISFDYSENKTKSSSDPYFLENSSVSAQLAYTPDENLWLGLATVSKEVDAVAVSAGFSSNYSITSSGDLINAIKDSPQDDSIGDIAVVLGINFAQTLELESELGCSLCIATGSSESFVVEMLKECLDYTPDSVSNPDKNIDGIVKISLLNNQTLNIISLSMQDLELEIYDMSARLLYSERINNFLGSKNIEFSLGNGTYFVNIKNGVGYLTKKINILK